MGREMFNSEQNEHIDYLNSLPLNKRCYCGWYDLGSCHNSSCDPTKTRVEGYEDYVKGMHKKNKWHDKTFESINECIDSICKVWREYGSNKMVGGEK